MIFSVPTSTSTSPQATGKGSGIVQLVVLALIVVVAVGAGAVFVQHATGPTGYACMSIAHQGGSEKITTSGLLHYVNSVYYISCSEGSNLPSGTYSASCLTITPKTVPAAIGLGASTEYYYISSTGTITLNGASAPVNATEYINPASISLTVQC